MERFDIFVPRVLPIKEYFAPGHRACIGCGEALAVRLVLKALGKNVIITSATGCIEIFSSALPTTSWRVPWIHTLFENSAAVASGIESGLKVLKRKGKIPERKITVVAMAGDGGTSDIGLQALSGAMERGHNFSFCCFDNEAYMNTGIQRSSATPYGAMTTTSPPGKTSIGQTTWKKDMPGIAAAHKIPYVATASPSYPFDLTAKVKRSMEIEGPCYLHILSVCPTGWRSAPHLSIQLGRLAVETGIFPLYEVERGKYTLSFDPPQVRPVAEYLKQQGRFRHLTENDIKKIQEKVTKDYRELKEKARR
jgi:pyruvate ferredoxin oxidoreductase beta subunit